MPVTNMLALSINKLSKWFGKLCAVDNVDLAVHPGEIYALIGQNGAGKTTLIKMLTGLLIPSSGKTLICGHNIQTEPMSAKTYFGYVPDDPAAYEYLTGRELLILAGRLRGLTGDKLTGRIHELSTIFPIENIFDERISEYSRGNKQKIAILASIITKPKLLIIDEPIVGLDSMSIDILGNLFKSYSDQGNAIFFVTHILDFAQKYADKAAVMENGKIKHVVTVNKASSLDKYL